MMHVISLFLLFLGYLTQKREKKRYIQKNKLMLVTGIVTVTVISLLSVSQNALIVKQKKSMMELKLRNGLCFYKFI